MMNTLEYIKEILLKKAKNELAYISDMESHEVVYLTERMQKALNVEEKDWKGKRCYELLRGATCPCEDCKQEDGVHVVHHPLLKKWVRIESHIYEAEGRTYRGEWLLDVTKERKEFDELQDRLARKAVVLQGVRTLTHETDTTTAVETLLKLIGEYYEADYASIFEFNFSEEVVNNTYEWHAKGKEEQIANCQGIPLSWIEDWVDRLQNHQSFQVICSELDPDKPVYRWLKQQHIQKSLFAPVFRRQTLVGFLSVDNPRHEPEDATLLDMIADCITTEFLKKVMAHDLAYLNTIDSLTNLWNRRQYLQVVEWYTQQPPEQIGVFFVDLNGLKMVNESGGHDSGDRFIRQCAGCLEALCGQAFRIDGDEFVVLMPGIEEPDFRQQETKLRGRLKKLPSGSASLGAVWATGNYSIPELVDRADELMYAEKQTYYRTMHQEPGRRMGAAGDVLQDIRDGRFEVYYQPQVCLNSGELHGAEALVRKRDAEGMLIPPGQFIPVYEAAGVISHLDLHVFELVCADIRKWGEELQKFPMISVNFSRITLMEDGIVQKIRNICKKYQVKPQQITVEVTESTGKLSHEQLNNLVQEFQEAGFAVSLDDFGSRYSNLSILTYIDFQVIKLDKSLIDRMATDSKNSELGKTLITLCGETLKTSSLAEGVETAEQVKTLNDFHCDYVQGYYFSRPVPSAEFTAMLAENRIFVV